LTGLHVGLNEDAVDRARAVSIWGEAAGIVDSTQTRDEGASVCSAATGQLERRLCEGQSGCQRARGRLGRHGIHVEKHGSIVHAALTFEIGPQRSWGHEDVAPHDVGHYQRAGSWRGPGDDGAVAVIGHPSTDKTIGGQVGVNWQSIEATFAPSVHVTLAWVIHNTVGLRELENALRGIQYCNIVGHDNSRQAGAPLLNVVRSVRVGAEEPLVRA